MAQRAHSRASWAHQRVSRVLSAEPIRFDDFPNRLGIHSSVGRGSRRAVAQRGSFPDGGLYRMRTGR